MARTKTPEEEADITHHRDEFIKYRLIPPTAVDRETLRAHLNQVLNGIEVYDSDLTSAAAQELIDDAKLWQKGGGAAVKRLCLSSSFVLYNLIFSIC